MGSRHSLAGVNGLASVYMSCIIKNLSLNCMLGYPEGDRMPIRFQVLVSSSVVGQKDALKLRNCSRCRNLVPKDEFQISNALDIMVRNTKPSFGAFPIASWESAPRVPGNRTVRPT